MYEASTNHCYPPTSLISFVICEHIISIPIKIRIIVTHFSCNKTRRVERQVIGIINQCENKWTNLSVMLNVLTRQDVRFINMISRGCPTNHGTCFAYVNHDVLCCWWYNWHSVKWYNWHMNAKYVQYFSFYRNSSNNTRKLPKQNYERCVPPIIGQPSFTWYTTLDNNTKIASFVTKACQCASTFE
jgi:hypothetical protein